MSQSSCATMEAGREASPTKPIIFVLHPSDQLTDHLPIGDGLVANGFIRELLARGYRMHIAVRDVDMKCPLPANATIYPLGTEGALTSRLHVSSNLRERIIYMHRVRRLLRRLRKDERIDIIHQFNPVFSGLSLAVLGTDLPLVLGPFVPRWPDTPGSPKLSRMKTHAKTFFRNLICMAQQSQAKVLIVTSDVARYRIPAAERLRNKIVTIPLGLDTTFFRPRPELLNHQAPPSILFYANVWWRKGIFVLVEAFRIVVSAFPEVHLTIAGDGEDTPRVKKRLEELKLLDHVSMSGRVARDEAPRLFCSHTVYCLPSFGDPFGMSAIEAMSCGRPLVITDAGGLRHVVPEEGGLRVPPGDPKSLADALLKVLRSRELQESMGRANRFFAEENYSWPRVADKLESAYTMAMRT